MKTIVINGQNVELNPIEIPLSNGEVETQMEGQFQSNIVSISDTVLSNSNGTEYRVATISFKNFQNQEVQCSALMWESNYEKLLNQMEEGTNSLDSSKLTTLRISPSRPEPSIYVSHLSQTGRATMDTFGIDTGAFASQEVEEISEEELA